MDKHTAENGLPNCFTIYPNEPHAAFAPEAGERLVGTSTRLDGRPVTITAAEPTGDGGLRLTATPIPPGEGDGRG